MVTLFGKGNDDDDDDKNDPPSVTDPFGTQRNKSSDPPASVTDPFGTQRGGGGGDQPSWTDPFGTQGGGGNQPPPPSITDPFNTQGGPPPGDRRPHWTGDPEVDAAHYRSDRHQRFLTWARNQSLQPDIEKAKKDAAAARERRDNDPEYWSSINRKSIERREAQRIAFSTPQPPRDPNEPNRRITGPNPPPRRRDPAAPPPGNSRAYREYQDKQLEDYTTAIGQSQNDFDAVVARLNARADKVAKAKKEKNDTQDD